jgi:hypothetical protein
MPNVIEEPVPAEVAYAGTWRIEPIEADESVRFALQYAPSSSNQSGPVAIAKLGLTSDALAGEAHPVRFEARREAGTFVCRGTAEDGRGDGAFRFQPDPGYANAIIQTGLPPLTLHEHIQAGMFDIRSSFVQAIAATGLRLVSFSQLIGLKIFRIKSDDVSALHVSFPNASVDYIRALAMSKVTASYVEALRRAEIGNLSPDNVCALRAFGIDQAFIDGLAANGHRGLSIDDVVRLYSDSS